MRFLKKDLMLFNDRVYNGLLKLSLGFMRQSMDYQLNNCYKVHFPQECHIWSLQKSTVKITAWETFLFFTKEVETDCNNYRVRKKERNSRGGFWTAWRNNECKTVIPSKY